MTGRTRRTHSTAKTSSDTAVQTVARPTPNGMRTMTDFSMSNPARCLDFLITAHVLEVPGPQGHLAVLYQAESREFDRLQPVFDAISASLLQHLDPAE